MILISQLLTNDFLMVIINKITCQIKYFNVSTLETPMESPCDILLKRPKRIFQWSILHIILSKIEIWQEYISAFDEFPKSYLQFFICFIKMSNNKKIRSIKDGLKNVRGSFHVRWCKPWHDPLQNLKRIFQVTEIYKI